MEHAAEPRTTRASAESEPTGSGARRSGGILSTLFGGGVGGAGTGRSRAAASARARVPAEPLDPSKYWGGKPGLMALLIALVLGVAAFVFIAFGNLARVDDRGEALPQQFVGVYLETRSLITGEEVEATSTTILDAGGPGLLAAYATPVLVIAITLLAYRRAQNSRPLMIGVLSLAVLFFVGFATLYILSLLAMGIALYVARKAEMPTRLAQQAAEDEADEDEYDEEDLDEEDLDEDEDYDDEDYEDEYEDDEAEYDEEEVEDVEATDEDEDYDEDYEARLADGGKEPRKKQ